VPRHERALWKGAACDVTQLGTPTTPAGGALLRLDVSDNPMTGEAASALSQMLSRHTGLQSLNLSDTALGDDGIAAVVQGLPPCADSLQVDVYAEQREGVSGKRYTTYNNGSNIEASWELLTFCVGTPAHLLLLVVARLLCPAVHARGKPDAVSCIEWHMLWLICSKT
jgi:Leucine Rich repeat